MVISEMESLGFVMAFHFLLVVIGLFMFLSYSFSFSFILSKGMNYY